MSEIELQKEVEKARIFGQRIKSLTEEAVTKLGLHPEIAKVAVHEAARKNKASAGITSLEMNELLDLPFEKSLPRIKASYDSADVQDYMKLYLKEFPE